MCLAFFLAAVNLFKIFSIPYFPLIGDEAYYWLWSKHLDWSYIDHPPMISYLNFIIRSVFGNSEFGIRLTAIIIILIISYFIYQTSKELFDRRAARIAVFIFNLTPLFFGGGMFLVPQMPLFLFYSISLYLLIRIIKRNESHLWYPLGAAVGLGLLSDFIMFFFFLGAFLYIIINKDERKWLAKKEPYFAAVIAFLFFLPMLVWNINLGFPSLSYHGNRGRPDIVYNLLYTVLLQMILYTPPLFIIALSNAYNFIRGQKTDILTVFSSAVFIPFAFLSFLLPLGGHWLATIYLPVIAAIHKQGRLVIGTIIFFALLVNGLAFAYYIYLYPAPKELAGKEYTINRRLKSYIDGLKFTSGDKFIISNNLGLAALVSFHGKAKTYMSPGRHPQYDLWGKPRLKKGDNAVYFVLNEDDIRKNLAQSFSRVTEDKVKRIFTKDADIPNQTQIFICEGFRGGIIP